MNTLLYEVRRTYCQGRALSQFAPFPDNLRKQEYSQNIRAACDLMQADAALVSTRYRALTDKIRDVARRVHWRETYPEDGGGAAFMDRWGCFSIIGDKAPFSSESLRLFIVYMPAGLDYPWHRHPAEEMYLVLAGRAIFKRAGQAPETLSEGQTMFHASNQPHALETTQGPVLCLVAWRTHLTILPELVPAPIT